MPGSKVIVCADADIAINEVTPKGPLPLGMDKDINYTFANQTFIQNCLDWMVDSTGILETRSKDFTLRLLDPEKKWKKTAPSGNSSISCCRFCWSLREVMSINCCGKENTRFDEPIADRLSRLRRRRFCSRWFSILVC